MARALPVSSANDFAEARPGEWQALRGELVALLDQVESQYARSPGDPAVEKLARRVQDLRQQVAPQAAGRHQEALRSVKRAVDRFSEREDHPEPQMPTVHDNPQETLQSAIHEIRSRQGRRAPRAVPQADRSERERAEQAALRAEQERAEQERAESERAEQHRAEQQAAVLAEQASQRAEQDRRDRDAERQKSAEHIERMTGAVSGLSGRLEQLESELRTQASRQGDVSEIGRQVSNLAGVVHELAGAVGETGQVKRLETQMDDLARSMAQGSRVDMTALTHRITALSETVERLADMQAQQIAHERSMLPQTAALHEGMQSVEANLRVIYDRIDGIEKNYLLPPEEFERLTDEMAAFTRAMREHEHEPSTLIARVDALHARIDELDGRDGFLGELREDVITLRGAVISTFEPRFSALEDQIEELSDRLSARQPSELTIGQISDQIRYLVRRIDDTGEQLSGLAHLYAENEDREPAPDYEALAAMVATRTSEAIARASRREPQIDMERLADLVAARTSQVMARTAAPPQEPEPELGLDALEARMSRLFTGQVPPAAPAETPAPESLRPDGRLHRLDAAVEMAQRGHASLSEALETESRPRPARLRDRMPADPGSEAPIHDPRVSAAVPAAAIRIEDTVLRNSADIEEAAAAPRFAPGPIDRPARPESTLDEADEVFAAAAEPERRAEQPDPVEANSSRNTFIEAARRAALKQGNGGAEPSSNSLIGRALARFQPDADAGARGGSGRTQRPAGENARAAKLAKSTKSAVAKPAVADELRIEPRPGEEGPKESFLLRHRQPILLACAVVAVSLMTLNLIGQRMAPAAPPATPVTTVSTPSAAIEPLSQPVPAGPTTQTAAPVTPQAGLSPLQQAGGGGNVPTPRAPFIGGGGDPRALAAFGGNGTDPMPVGSIDPRAPALADPRNNQPQAAEAVAPNATPDAATAVAGPVKVDLPAEQVGPEALRQAAANGDPRAQFEVAAIYTEGRAVPQDFKAAATWYERAAAQGFAPAEYRLGSLYEGGKGVEKNLEQARLWYTRGAEAGNRMAMHNLAALYAGGELGKQDFPSAAHWFEEAASRGMTDSQFNLGMLYARGLGVQQNIETSYKWFSLAASRGDQDAAKARDDIGKSLNAEAASRIAGEIQSFKAGGIDLLANFAPIGTWTTSFDPGAPIADKDLVIKVQAALTRLGYDVGTPDGVAGPKTAVAIKAFERATGMSEVGAINPRLLAVLGSQPV